MKKRTTKKADANFIDGKSMSYDGKWRFTCSKCDKSNTTSSAPFLTSKYECTNCNEVLLLKHCRVASSKVWLPCEVEYLEANYPFLLNEEICAELGRPLYGLQTKASELNIYKDPSFFDPETGPYFRDRGLPDFCNPQHDGAISIRYYRDGKNVQYIRISNCVWKPLHRHLWEEENGSIPEGHYLTFIDEDPMNADISNLQLISLKEQIKKNTFNRFPLELQQQILLTAKLERKIKSNASK